METEYSHVATITAPWVVPWDSRPSPPPVSGRRARRRASGGRCGSLTGPSHLRHVFHAKSQEKRKLDPAARQLPLSPLFSYFVEKRIL